LGGGFRNTVQPLDEDDERLMTLSMASGQRVKTTAAAAVVVKAPRSQGSEAPTAKKAKGGLKRPRNISGGFRNAVQPLDEDDERLTPVSMEMSPRRKRERDGDEGEYVEPKPRRRGGAKREGGREGSVEL